MDAKLLNDHGGVRTFAVVFASGDAVMEGLGAFVARHGIAAAQITGIGAFSRATLKYFDWEAKDYVDIPVAEQVEVASFLGDVALGPDGKPALHVHLVLGRRDGSALAGHLGEATVRPTLELIITEQPAHLHKTIDPETKLALIRPRL